MDDSKHEEPKGWAEYRLLIVGELERLNRGIEDLNRKIDEFRNNDISGMKVRIAMLEVRSGFIGAIAGLIAAGLISVLVNKT